MKHIKKFESLNDDDFEARVIEVLGKNHKNAIQFDDALNHDEPYGLYTHRGGVHIIKAGEEWLFNDLTNAEKKTLISRFDSKRWKINKALQ